MNFFVFKFTSLINNEACKIEDKPEKDNNMHISKTIFFREIVEFSKAIVGMENSSSPWKKYE